MPAPSRPDQRDQGLVLELDLLAGVEIEVADLQRDPGAGLPSASSSALWAAIRLR